MRFVLVTVALVAFTLNWYRQYLKFQAGNGIFHYLSPTHGEWWLHGTSLALTLIVVAVFFSETKNKR